MKTLEFPLGPINSFKTQNYCIHMLIKFFRKVFYILTVEDCARVKSR